MANHSTFDGNTQYSLEEYFKKIYDYCEDEGVLVFESHHPDYEKNLEAVLKVIEKYFVQISLDTIVSNSFMDNGRKIGIFKKHIGENNENGNIKKY